MPSCSAAQWVAAQEPQSIPQAQSAVAFLVCLAVAAAHRLTQKLQQNLRSVSRPLQKGGGPDGRPEFNLNDVDRMSQTGARAVVEAAHVDIAEDIKQAVKDLKDRLQSQRQRRRRFRPEKGERPGCGPHGSQQDQKRYHQS